MHATARPGRCSACLRAHGNQIDGGALYVSGRDQIGVVGQELIHLLNGSRLDALLVERLLQSAHLAENETQRGGVGIALRKAGEGEWAPSRSQRSSKLLAAGVAPGGGRELVLPGCSKMPRMKCQARGQRETANRLAGRSIRLNPGLRPGLNP